MYLQAIQLWKNRGVQQALEFISSLVIKLAIEKNIFTSYHDSNESFLTQIACRKKTRDFWPPLLHISIYIDTVVYQPVMAGFQNHKSSP